MATLRDLAPAIRSVGFFKFIIQVCIRVSRDNLTTQAAAVAYAWLFAIFPFLIFLLTLFAFIPEKQKVNAQELIASSIHRVMAHDAADTMITNLNEVFHPAAGLSTVFLVVTLWIASGGMAMTMSALDAAFGEPQSRPFYIQRPLAILLTIVATVLLLVVLALLPIGAAIEGWLANTGRIPQRILWALTLLRYVLAILLMLANVSLLYKFGTRVRHRFVFFSPGVVFTVLVWIVLGEGFRFYVDKFGRYQKTYGAVGGVTIILLFFYLDALVMLIGAEINNLVDSILSDEPPASICTGSRSRLRIEPFRILHPPEDDPAD
jgi:membrane protein